MRKRLALASVFLILCAMASAEASADASLQGNLKSFLMAFRLPASFTELGTFSNRNLFSWDNRLRLDFMLKPRNWVNFEAAADFSLRLQDSILFTENLFFSGINPEIYRLVDFSNPLYPGTDTPVGNFGVFLNLDRFLLTFRFRWADLLLGRQAIAWGSARIINPTDIIAPFVFNELDKEERFGIDAVRMRLPLGAMDELDIGFVAGQNLAYSKNAAFLRGKTHLWKTDLSFVFLGFRQHGLFGIDLARSIGGAGFWLESAYAVPYLFDASRKGEEEPYFRASVGADYNFSPKLYGYCEYHFNSGGESRPQDYIDFFDSVAFRDGSVYLLGKHYLGASLVYQFSPLLPGSVFFLYNLLDGSLMFAFQLEYNVSQNIYLSAGSYLGLGKAPGFIPGQTDGPGLTLRSEFGSYTDTFYISFRIYF
jgi:hypothetical protein